MLYASAACYDSNVPYLTAPTAPVPTPSGVDNDVSGLFAASRIDMTIGISGFLSIAVGMARDGAIFTFTEPRTVLYPLGVEPMPSTSGSIWPQEYTNIRQAQQILAILPTVTPAYTSVQTASITGVVQTLMAYNYMLVAEAHDTLGIALLPANITLSSLPPGVCNRDAWSEITALLDSGEKNLETAGSLAPTSVLKLPTGFLGVGTASGPPTTLGSFASFNRALAAKAHMEWAYAIARSSGASAPTPTSPGSPNVDALTAAMADLDSSAMFDSTGAALSPTSPGGFIPSARVVTHDFSGLTNDVPNPVAANISTIAVLRDFLADVDTAHDLRFKAKFIINPYPVQEPTYNPAALITAFDPATGRDSTYSYTYNMYPTESSPMPILRDEGLTLIAAQIQMGLGNYAKALTYVNLVRTTVGGLPAFPGSVASSYTSMRDSLMKEQRVSTTWESSADRTIAIRMYGLAAVADTTWGTPGHPNEAPGVSSGDTHITLEPIPIAETNGRNGTFTTTCTSPIP
jgi:starch-binding outer membrane protein, SusD/RagB family